MSSGGSESRDAGRWRKRFANLAGWCTRPPPAIAPTPHVIAHRENKLRLLHYQPRPAGLAFPTPILLVPSLINRHYVLDLAPGKSLVQHLVGQGHDVWCVDWGTPGPEDRYLDFDDYAGRYLGRCLRIAARSSRGGKAHLLGYCMGGMFTVAHAAVDQRYVASLIALAAPVRFEDDGLLARWTESPDFDVDALAEATGNVPWQLLQGSFNLLRPTLPLTKLVGVIDRADKDGFLDGFAALEAWANDNVSVPGAFYRTYIDKLYRGDAFVRGGLSVRGRPVRLGAITIPTLTIAFEQDTIAPVENCAALHELVGSKDRKLLRLQGSHVGSVVSRRAASGVWAEISAWCAQRGEGSSTTGRSKRS